jgi:response regulator RpfG family c-di-GMP phosphodiesterase
MAEIKPHKILIVDDEPAVRKILDIWLTKDGYKSQIAKNGEEALSFLKKNKYALMISDIMMPGISGIELLRKSIELYPDMAVIMATAVDERKTALESFELGAFGYMIKPFERNATLIYVANVLRRRELEIVNKSYRQNLEQQVHERTKELIQINKKLKKQIAERKKAEKEILEAKQDWEDTFNSITDIITIHDADYNIIKANKAAEEILDLPVLKEVSSAKCFRYYHGKGCPPAGCPSCDSLKTGKPIISEAFEPHLDKFLEIRAIPKIDNNNKLAGLIHIVRDITSKKASENQIKKNLEQFRALHTIDMTITASLDLQYTLSVFLEQVVNLLKVDAADILLLNPHSLDLEFKAGIGLNAQATRRRKETANSGSATAVISLKKTIALSESEVDSAPISKYPFLKQENIKSYIVIPLSAKGKLKGVLEIFHRSPLKKDQDWLDFLELLAGQAAIAIDNAAMFDDLQTSHDDLVRSYNTTIEGWSRALDYRDKETEGHSRRVTELTLEMAKSMGIRESELVHIKRGALLHDIGKLGVPDSILLKPGKLTEEEWVIMKNHANIAYELLFPIAYLRPAIDIPYCHHERWDGTGYPRGLKGEQIPLAARIFAIIDVWDALRSDRPYRDAWPEEKVIAHLKQQAGTHFDPEVVDAFLQLIK